MNNGTTTVAERAALQRCLNSPYLFVDESKVSQAPAELSAARQFYDQARASFDEEDEATGLKEAWAVMYRAMKALVYKAGYRGDQFRCMEIVLRAHYPQITAEDIGALHRAQELVGPPDAALDRAEAFLEKAAALV